MSMMDFILIQSIFLDNIFLISTVTLLILYLIKRVHWVRPNRVTVLGYPIFGNLFQVPINKYMEPTIELCKKYGPIFDMSILFTRFTVISSYDDAKEIFMKRPTIFRRAICLEKSFQSVGMERGLFSIEGSEWSIQRRVTAPWFAHKNISRYIQNLQSHAQYICDIIYADGSTITDFFDLSLTYTIRIIGSLAFGYDANNDQSSYFFSTTFKQDLATLLSYVMIKIFNPLPNYIWQFFPSYKIYPQAMESLSRVNSIVQEMIQKERRLHRQDSNYLSNLLHVQDESKLSDDDVIANIKILYVAGTDTTSNIIAWLLYFLCIYPAFLQEIRQELHTYGLDKDSIITTQDDDDNNDDDDDENDSHTTTNTRGQSYMKTILKCHFLKACIQETLRLRNSTGRVFFSLVDTTQPYTLKSGHIIHPDSIIWVCLDALNRDPAVFSEPERYNPRRWIDVSAEVHTEMEAHLSSFGGGTRVCPGMQLAYIETMVLMIGLINRYNFTLACTPAEIERIATFTVRPNKMPIIFTKKS